MFFAPERIAAIREMIVSKDVEQRKKALEKLLPMQREDFEGLFRAMDGLPVTIRLLDPPLHEFLPHTDEEIAELAKEMEIEYNGEILIKTRNSEKQSMQSFLKRRQSVKNIFQITDILKVRGKKVILIDDVFATGSTANECSKELIKAGAKSVIVAVISISHTLK